MKNAELSETNARGDLLVMKRRVFGDTGRETWAGGLANTLTGLPETENRKTIDPCQAAILCGGAQRPRDVTRHHLEPRTTFLPLSCSTINIDCRRFDGLASRLWSPMRCHRADDTSRAVPQNTTRGGERGGGGLIYPRHAPHLVPGSSRGQNVPHKSVGSPPLSPGNLRRRQ